MTIPRGDRRKHLWPSHLRCSIPGCLLLFVFASTSLLFSPSHCSAGHHGEHAGHHGEHVGHHPKGQGHHKDHHTGNEAAQSEAGAGGAGVGLATPQDLEIDVVHEVPLQESVERRETTADPCKSPPPSMPASFSLGLPELPSPVTTSGTPSYNPRSRYLTTGLTFGSKTGAPEWSFAKDVDWRYLLGPVDNQDQYGKCGSCWAFASSAAIQAAYAIQGGQRERAVEPSEQQFLDCTVGTCEGGYPTDSLQYAADPTQPPVFAAHVYSYQGVKGKCQADKFKYAPSSKIAMFEQTAFQGPLALILALQRQPVVVNLRGSAPSFQAYTGGVYNDTTCYDEENIILDHTVLVVGYHFEGLGTCSNNYFIIRNSWGKGWGEDGHMRIAMTFTPNGICGITAELGLYPVIKAETFTQPCSFGVCGGGSCSANESTGISSEGASSGFFTTPSPPAVANGGCVPQPPPSPPPPTFSCNCSSQPFLAPTTNIDGTQSCVSKVQCGLFQSNPCGQGTCVDDGAGGYSCICPSGTRKGNFTDGTMTCVPVEDNSPENNISTYTTQPGDTCYLVYTLFSLTEEDFLGQNPGLDCSKSLSPGTEVNVKHTVTCAVRYPVSSADESSGSCGTIQAKFPGVDLAQLNPGLNCAGLVAGQQLCVQAGNPGFNSSQMCTQYEVVNERVSCDSVVKQYGLTYLTLYQLNPGLLCDNLNALSGQQICVKGYPLAAVRCGPPTRMYRVTRSDTCITIVVQQFKRRSGLVPKLNGGWVCNSRSLFTGMPLCAPVK